ncbi:MAG: RNA polymerase factor sigma-54 [Treponemataceae bacterium]
MDFSLSQQQRQTLNLSQELIQSLNILALPTTDLRETILKELNANPTLEIVNDKSEKKTHHKLRPKQYERIKHKTKMEADEYQSFLESIPDSSESLQMHLIKQFSLLPLKKNELEFGRVLIQNLDDSGFNITSTKDLREIFNKENPNLKITKTSCEKIIGLIQKLEPIGCCTKDSIHSLACQAKILFADKAQTDKFFFAVVDLLENHKALFKLGNKTKFFSELKKINSNYNKLSYDDSKKILEIISTLDIAPGKKISSSKIIFAVPEIFIIKTETGFNAYLNDIEIPQLKISKVFEGKNFNQNEALKNALQNAKQFIESLNYRREAILKVATAILAYQKKFFEKGPKFLQAIKQIELASELDLSPSTISRIVNGKYLQCDWGVFELKYFFSSEVPTFGAKANVSTSKNAVKEIIKTIIDENPKITDAKITEKLKLKGISLSRRTVNKYRNEL